MKIRTTIEAIRDRCPGLIINMSSAIGGGVTKEQRIARIVEMKPEMASLNTKSMNFGIANWRTGEVPFEVIFDNTFAMLVGYAKTMRENQVKPECEVYDFGGLYNVLLVRKQGIFDEPMHCLLLSRYRLALMIGILIITGIFSIGAFRVGSAVILQDMLPYDHPYLKLHNRFSEVFGSGGSTVAIALKAKKGDIFNTTYLTKLQKMTNEVLNWDEIIRGLTVSISARSVKVVRTLKKGEINVVPLMWPDVPKDIQEMELLKKNVFSSPAYNGSLVSRDGTAALLLTECKENISYVRMFDLLQKLVKDYTDGETSVHIVGFPMLMGWIYSLRPQMYFVFGISILGIALRA